MARDGMAELISYVRQESHAGTADHTIGGVTYWSDNQIQERLDRTQVTHKRVSLHAEPSYIDGAYDYREYHLPEQFEWVERNETDSGWALRDGDGVSVGTADYSVNYDARVITFDADTDNEIYYLDARTYDVYSAIADVWQAKVGFYESSVDWSSDNHRVSNNQKWEHAKAMVAKFRAMGKGAIQLLRRVRVDERPRRW